MICSLIVSFSLTMIIEYIIVKVMCIKKKVFIPVLLVNLLTNPLVVYTYYLLNMASFVYKDTALFILEIIVVFVEAYVYKLLLDIKYIDSLKLSFLANAIAYIAGLLL